MRGKVMTKIFIDTMIFLNFYRAKDEPLIVLNELVKVQDLLVFPEQVNNEFWRNRSILLRSVKKEVNNCLMKQYSTAFLEAIPNFKEARQKVNEVQRMMRQIGERISSVIDDPASDQVAQRFMDVFKNSKKVSYYHRNS